MLVLGISASPAGSGWALVDVNLERGRIVSTGRVRGSGGEVISALAGQMAALPSPPELVVVEDVRPSERTYSQTVGRWLQAFDGLGVESVTVAPGIWQAALVPGDGDRQTAGARTARSTYGTEVVDPDAACAALWAGRKRSR